MPQNNYTRAPQLQSLKATTTEAPVPAACAPQERSHLLQLEKAHSQQRRLSATKNKEIYFKNLFQSLYSQFLEYCLAYSGLSENIC